VAASDIFTCEVGTGDVPMDIARNVDTAEGFGRVFPEHKWAIVKSAQQLGHIVGMTGDGVNDAPALKQGDVGVAVSGATEAARAAAGLILTAPGLSVIIRGIEEARRTFDRMMGYAYYRIATTITIMLVVVLVMVVSSIQVLTPIMIILLALLDDVPVMLIAFDNAKVSPRPSKWDKHRVLLVSSMLALLSVVQSAGLLHHLHRGLHIEVPTLQTCMFMQLVIAGHLLLFSTRSRGLFFQRPFPEWKLFCAIMGTQVFAAFMAANGWLVPAISWRLISLIWVYNLVWLFIIDAIKVELFHRCDVRESGGSEWHRRLHMPLGGFHGRMGKVVTTE
jgi:H+-transporting ATPase